MSDVIELPISEFVSELLEPISNDAPYGIDAANEEEYFKLNGEFAKNSPDYKNWIELSDLILKKKSKDLRVAVWLCFALYRTEYIKGLKEGLELIYHLLKKFENNLFPSNPLHKSKAIQFFNTSRVTKLLEREEITKQNAEDAIAAKNFLNDIIKENERLLPDNIPSLNIFTEVINSLAEAAEKVLNPPVQQVKKTIPPKPIPYEPKSKVDTPKEPSEPGVSKQLSEDEASIQLRRILNNFLEIVQDGQTKEKIPESFFVFGIARQIQWSSLTLPAAEEKITNIEPPNEIIQRNIKEWFNENKFDLLIPIVESEFIKDNSEFRYWLDVQRYLVNALERKGGNYIVAATDIKIHLARLVKRLPELLTFKFRGGELPFADEETIKWINNEIKTIISGNKSDEAGSSILPPIIDKTYDHISKEYEQAINELPNRFEDNFNEMQNGINSELMPKGKFLRRLNLANYCYEVKQYNIAKVNLEELKKLIEELNLCNWEPALSTAVWQSLYLTNIQLLFNTNNENSKNLLEKEQEELFYEIARFNGILAINLEQQKHKRRK